METTQAGEVIFDLVGEIVLLGVHVPLPLAFIGIAVVVGGMIVHSFAAHSPAVPVAT